MDICRCKHNCFGYPSFSPVGFNLNCPMILFQIYRSLSPSKKIHFQWSFIVYYFTFIYLNILCLSYPWSMPRSSVTKQHCYFCTLSTLSQIGIQIAIHTFLHNMPLPQSSTLKFLGRPVLLINFKSLTFCLQVSTVPGLFSSPGSTVNKAISKEVCELVLMPNLDLSAKSVSKEGPQKQNYGNYCYYEIRVNALFLHQLKVQPVFKTMGWCRFWTFWVVLHVTALRVLSNSTL